jgi:HNH endonuclease
VEGIIYGYRMGTRMFLPSLRGRAWIAVDTFQTLTLETDLVAPLPQVPLDAEHISIAGKQRQKRPWLKLPLAEYRALRLQVLQRDGWRCQFCGASKDLHVHHLKSRGRLGDDTLRSLLTLCVRCHAACH